MKIRHFNIIAVLFFFWSYNTYSQSNCTVPLPPVLTSITVEPESGKTDFNWTLSPSDNIAAYIIYSYKNGDAQPIDTIWDPTATSFSFTSTATKYFSVSYVVTAHRRSAVPGEPGCTSPLSNVLTTIFCSSGLDTCNNKMSVKWNKYNDYPNKVIDYKILVSLNNGPLSELYSADKSEDNYTIPDFTPNSQYCIVVKADLEGGIESNSNKSCLSTKMQRPPSWINADYASINSDKYVNLSFTIDPLSEINHYILERKSGTDTAWQILANSISDNNKVLYTDAKADITNINYYRLSAINSCNIPVTVSNISSNLVLKLDATGDDLNLSWNSYKKWLGEISSYRLFINTGKGYEEKEAVQASDTTITLGYKQIMYEITGSEVCFYIDAMETANPHGVEGNSVSSVVCISPKELVTVPNVFTPDNDLVNDLFRPVLSFTPIDYHLIISDRKGNVLFETRDYQSDWDGTHNGIPQPQGVYLWFIKVSAPSGKNISKTGTITIVHNK